MKTEKPLLEDEILIPVTIACPECGSLENANIKVGNPFNTYIHECSECGFIIMESDWDQYKPDKIKEK